MGPKRRDGKTPERQRNEEEQKSQVTADEDEELEVAARDHQDELAGKDIAQALGREVSVVAIEPPMLDLWEASELRRFVRERAVYEAKVKAQRRMGYRVEPIPLGASLSPWAMSYVAKYVAKKTADEITESDLERLMNVELRTSGANVAPRELRKALLRELDNDRGRTGVVAGVTRVFMAVEKVVEMYGLGEQAEEFVVKEVIELLKPVALRRHLEDMKTIDSTFPKRSLVAFHALCLRTARDLERWEPATDVNPRDSGGVSRTMVCFNCGKPGHKAAVCRSGSTGSDTRPRKAERKADRTTNGSGQLSQRVTDKLGCFACGRSGHRVVACPDLTVEERRMSLGRLRAAGKLQPRQQAVDSSVISEVLGESLGGVTARIKERDVQALLDSGAAVSLMATRTADWLGLEAEPCTPVQCRSFIPGAMRVARSSVKCAVELVTSGGTAVADAEFLLIDEDLPHILIGEPVLQTLGISPRQCLERLARRLEEVAHVAVTPIQPSVEQTEEEDYDGPAMVTIPVSDTVDDPRDKIEAMIGRAVEAGMSQAGREKLEKGLEGLGCWRTALGTDPPARVQEYAVEVRPDCTPFRARARRCAPQQSEALKAELGVMVRAGLVHRNMDSAWGSAAVALPKPGGRGYRMVVDLRAVNARTVRKSTTLPDHGAQARALHGSRVYATVDLFKGFWQVPLAAKSREIFSIVTDFGVFTPERMMMGASDASAHFQACVTHTLGDLVGRVVHVWIDDLLIFAQDEEAHIRNVLRVLRRLDSDGWKLDPSKCQLYTTQARWCGRMYSAEGVRHDPDRVEAIVQMPRPETVGQLQQLLGAVSWMRDSLPDYARIAQPLTEALEAGLREAGSRKRRVAENIQLTWTPEMVSAYDNAIQLLKKVTLLAYPKADAVVRVYTDASSTGWAIVVVQMEAEVMEPLVFMSGLFTDAQRRWSTLDKEAYPLFIAARKLDYLLLRSSGFEFCTDHKNLIYIFNPEAHQGVHRCAVERVQRWAMTIGALKYTIRHVPGADNLWADLLTRWGQPTRQVRNVGMVHKVASLPEWRLAGPGQIVWPTKTEIMRCGGKVSGNRITIPDESNLRQRLLVLAHAGLVAHAGRERTMANLLQFYEWDSMRQDVWEFVDKCIHCRMVDEKKTHVILGDTIQGTRPNEVLHFDYVYIGTGTKYMLVLKDGYSGFVELVATDAADAWSTAKAIVEWIGRYGIPTTFVSDRGTHFKNVLMAEIARQLGIQQHFTIAYCPWSNGTVERANKEILRVLRVMLSETKLNMTEWHALLPVVQYAVNCIGSKYRAGYSPRQIFLGREQSPTDSPLHMVTMAGELVTLNVDDWVGRMNHLRVLLDDMHIKVLSAKERKRALKNGSKDRLMEPPFKLGDFVMYETVSTSRGKLQSKRQGPAQIVEIVSSWVYGVKDLVGERTRLVHATRLHFYEEKTMEITKELKEHLVYHSPEYEVEQIVDARLVDETQQWELRVCWRGFEPEDSTWENAQKLVEDVPSAVRSFMRTATANRDFLEAFSNVF